MYKKIKTKIGLYENSISQNEINNSILSNELIHIKGLVGSGKSFRIASAFKKSSHNFFIILTNAEQAAYYLNDFENILSKDEVLFFPSSFKKEATQEVYENSNILF